MPDNNLVGMDVEFKRLHSTETNANNFFDLSCKGNSNNKNSTLIRMSILFLSFPWRHFLLRSACAHKLKATLPCLGCCALNTSNNYLQPNQHVRPVFLIFVILTLILWTVTQQSSQSIYSYNRIMYRICEITALHRRYC